MFRSVIGQHRRWGRALGVALVLAALLGGSFPPVPATAGWGDETPPLDLAAMVLTPADLAGAGQAGFGVAFGRTLSAGDLADRAVWPAGQGPELDEVREALVTAGWRQAYVGVLTTVRAGDDDGPIRDIEVEVVAYADAAGATEGFSLIPDAYVTGESEQVAGMPTIGDESRITRIDARDPGSGTAFPELALGFRHERLTARVVIRDLGGATPEVGEIEALAEALLTRIERVLATGGPGLSLVALRVEPRAAGIPASDAYLRLDGVDLPSAFAPLDAAYRGAIDVFAGATEIVANDSSDNLGFRTLLVRFPTEDHAASWLGAASDRFHETPDLIELKVEPATADLGDEAIAMTMTRDPGGDGLDVSRSAVVMIRVAGVVAEVRLERAHDAPPLAAALDLTREQARCLEMGACLRRPPAPVSLTGGLDGHTYASPTFGYRLTWDPAVWGAIAAVVRDGHDRLVLSHYAPEGVSEVAFDAHAGHDGDPEECLASIVDEVLTGATEVRSVEDSRGEPIAGRSDGFVFAAFTYTTELATSGQPIVEERAGWFACRTLRDGEAVLAVRLVTADRAAFADHLALLPDLLANIELPGASGSILDRPSG